MNKQELKLTKDEQRILEMFEKIAERIPDLCLDEYAGLCHQVNSRPDDADIRLRRCKELMRVIRRAILEADPTNSDTRKLGHLISEYEEHYECDCSKDEVEVSGYTFKGKTDWGKQFVDLAGELLASDSRNLIASKIIAPAEIINIAISCRDFGAPWHAYSILAELRSTGRNSRDVGFAMLDIFRDPFGQIAPCGEGRMHDQHGGFLYDIKNTGGYIDETVYNKLEAMDEKSKSEDKLFSDLVKADISNVGYRNPRWYVLVAKQLLSVIGHLSETDDFFFAISMIPQWNYNGALDYCRHCEKCNATIVSKIAERARRALDESSLFAIYVALCKWDMAIELLDGFPTCFRGINKSLERMRCLAPVPDECVNPVGPICSHETISTLLDVCAAGEWLIAEYCRLRSSPNKFYAEGPSPQLAEHLYNPAHVRLYALMGLSWWRFPVDTVRNIVLAWQKILESPQSSHEDKRAVFVEIAKCPDKNISYPSFTELFLTGTKYCSDSIRVGFAAFAASREDYEAAIRLLGGIHLVYFYPRDGHLVLEDPAEWNTLYTHAMNAGTYRMRLIDAMIACLPDDTCEVITVSSGTSDSADSLDGGVFDGAFLKASALEEDNNYDGAYSVMESSLARQSQNRPTPGRILLACKYAYLSGRTDKALAWCKKLQQIKDLQIRLISQYISPMLSEMPIGLAMLITDSIATHKSGEKAQCRHDALLRLLAMVADSSGNAFLDDEESRKGGAISLAGNILFYYRGGPFDRATANRSREKETSLQTLRRYYAQDGAELFDLKMRLAIIESSTPAHMDDIASPTWYTLLLLNASRNVRNAYEKQALENQRKVYEARLAERNQVIADMSHHIKNLVAKVLDPLQHLRSLTTDDTMRGTVDNALRGGALIREIVQAMNLSYRGGVDDFVGDARSTEASGYTSMEQLLVQAVMSALTNMFDGKYFKRFVNAYFPTRDMFVQSKSQFTDLQARARVSVDDVCGFVRSHMFDLDIRAESMRNLYLRDDNGSQVKMLIVLNEMFMNAIKYTSDLKREQRRIDFEFAREDGVCRIDLSNTCSQRRPQSSAGLGHVVLENFSKIMGGQSKVVFRDGLYRLLFEFKDFWKDARENTLR